MRKLISTPILLMTSLACDNGFWTDAAVNMTTNEFEASKTKQKWSSTLAICWKPSSKLQFLAEEASTSAKYLGKRKCPTPRFKIKRWSLMQKGYTAMKDFYVKGRRWAQANVSNTCYLNVGNQLGHLQHDGWEESQSNDTKDWAQYFVLFNSELHTWWLETELSCTQPDSHYIRYTAASVLRSTTLSTPEGHWLTCAW